MAENDTMHGSYAHVGIGSEVQCTLATVVIGGIVASTLLTLVVLPILLSAASGESRAILRCQAYAWGKSGRYSPMVYKLLPRHMGAYSNSG